MELKNFHLSHSDPKIVATFDVSLGDNGDLVYPNMRVRRGNKGGFYFVRPGYVKGTDDMGNKHYGHYPEMSPEKWKSFSEQVNHLLKPLLPHEPTFF